MFKATGVVSAGSAREPGSLPQGRLGLCWGPVRLVTSLDYGRRWGEGGPENTLPSTGAYGGGRIGKPRCGGGGEAGAKLRWWVTAVGDLEREAAVTPHEVREKRPGLLRRVECWAS